MWKNASSITEDELFNFIKQKWMRNEKVLVRARSDADEDAMIPEGDLHIASPNDPTATNFEHLDPYDAYDEDEWLFIRNHYESGHFNYNEEWVHITDFQVFIGWNESKSFINL